MLTRVRRWWQTTTGQVETPVVTDVPWWLASLALHLTVLVVLAKIFLPGESDRNIRLVSDRVDPVVLEDKEPEVRFDEIEPLLVGEAPLDSLDFSEDSVPILEMKREDFLESIQPQTDLGLAMLDNSFDLAAAGRVSMVPVKGSVGNAVSSASGAVDRITEEIILSLDQRDTLVIWLFDQSPSMMEQQAEILERLEKIYAELEQVANLGYYGSVAGKEPPLLTQVYSFGQSVNRMMKHPSENFEDIRKAFSEITRDSSGLEFVFTAVLEAVTSYKSMRSINWQTGNRERNIMIIVVTDESGDDAARLDDCVLQCSHNEIPVYVIGVPAPFGRVETLVRWIDPDPNFNQDPQFTSVSQGPETLMPERLRLEYFNDDIEEFESIDSGFGPFGLTRLAYESGGIYFAVHPNRETGRAVARGETQAFTAYMRYFFDSDVMKRYRPDYVSREGYLQKVDQNTCRQALVQAASLSSIVATEKPDWYFPRYDDAQFVRQVSRAQRDAAILEPQVAQLYEILKAGESDRDIELSPRWQAGYDLAFGRIMAAKVRIESYNAMLALVKGGAAFQNPKNNVWILQQADTIQTGSAAAKMAERAREYLDRVIRDHPGTPWALRAQKELETPIGWKWVETFREPPVFVPAPPPKPRRDPPKL